MQQTGLDNKKSMGEFTHNHWNSIEVGLEYSVVTKK